MDIRPIDAAVGKVRVQAAVLVVSRDDSHKDAIFSYENDLPVGLPCRTGNKSNRRLGIGYVDLPASISAVAQIRRTVTIEFNERKLERAAAAVKPVTLADDQNLAVRQDKACQRNVVNSCIGGSHSINSKRCVELPDSRGYSNDEDGNCDRQETVDSCHVCLRSGPVVWWLILLQIRPQTKGF